MAKFKKLNRFSILFIVILVVVAVVALFALIFREEYFETDVSSTSILSIEEATVVGGKLNIKGLVTDDDLDFSYNQVRYENDRMYIKLYSTKRKMQNGNNINLTLSVPEGINKILIEGKTEDDVKTIWQADQ